MENIEVACKRINAIIQTCNNTNIFILQSCQARIEEFFQGGPTFRKFLTSKKKKKKKKKTKKKSEKDRKKRVWLFFPFCRSMVKNVFPYKLIVGKKWSFVQLQASLHKHTDDVVVLIL